MDARNGTPLPHPVEEKTGRIIIGVRKPETEHRLDLLVATGRFTHVQALIERKQEILGPLKEIISQVEETENHGDFSVRSSEDVPPKMPTSSHLTWS